MPQPAEPQGVQRPNEGDTTAAGPERDRIERRAYELYLARGGSQGTPMEDWLTAEREFTSTSGKREQKPSSE